MPWTLEQRNLIVNRLAEFTRQLTGENRKRYSDEKIEAIEREEEKLIQEYVENLPLLRLSRCPICNEALEIPIDLGGLDGPWWWELCPEDFPLSQGCEHYQVFLGALDLHGRIPQEVTDGVSPGPGIPFVIARLLEMDEVSAVISSVTLATGDTGYLIVYYSEEELDPMDLHQEWRHEFYSLLDADGEPEFSESKLDPWDYDIDSWIEKGKLYWIAPGDADFSLMRSLPSPYSGLKGTRMSQVIGPGEVELEEPPQGGESALYEPAD